ncbi:MAG: alpha/beta fold hydrolase, partial [Actinomycetota bacterium]
PAPRRDDPRQVAAPPGRNRMTFEGLEHTPQLARSFDGTFIAVRKMGRDGAPPLLVVNAIGANLAVWRRVLVDVVRDGPAITWDHRGLYESGEPASDRLDPGAHAEDAVAALEHHLVERFAIASWSNGSRIALEIAARHPDRVTGLLMVSGGYGHPVTRLLSNLELISAIPPAAGVAKHFAPLLEGPFRALVSRPELTGLIRQSGMIAASADTAALVDLVRGMASCDLRMLLRNFEAVVGDAAPDLLSEVQAPTLLIAGEHDQFTSRSMTDEVLRAIPGARLELYEDATHYLPIEYPARLSDDLRRFLSGLPRP